MPPKKNFSKKPDADAKRAGMISRALNRSKRIKDIKPIDRRTTRR